MRELLSWTRSLRAHLRLPSAAKAEYHRDRRQDLGEDPGIDRAIDAATGWLCRAQDYSVSHDGGVAGHYSLVSGWGTSYPETTGYIIPTVLMVARHRQDEALRARARQMLDWLAGIQLPDGGFQGGLIGDKPVVPVAFNTGQILVGLASGVHEFGEVYRSSLRAAAEWLVVNQDPDGCWRKHSSPFATPGERAYQTHIGWGLLEAARVDPNPAYVDAALRSVHWALAQQSPNGWFAKCCLNDATQPLTHTLGYALRGAIEAYRFSGQKSLLDASRKTAEGLHGALRADGFLPGRLDAQWRGTVRWACLTGTVQVAHCWLQLYEATGDRRFRDAAFAANHYVRSTLRLDGPPETRGVKGSFPVSGGYQQYRYPNWACKFFIDANLLEKETREREA
jgi:hypothetical protein